MKWYAAIFLLVSFLLIGSSCKKNPEYLKVSQEMQDLSFCNYKYGTYWIMKDSASNILDSFSGGGINVESYGGGSKKQYQTIQTSLYEYINNVNTSSWIIILNVLPHCNVSYWLFIPGSYNNRVIYDPFLVFPLDYRDFADSYHNDSMYRSQNVTISIIENYTLNNQSFDSVYHLHYSFPGKTNVEDFYINKKVGLIKIVQDNDQIKRTLEVQKWNLVK